VGKKGRLPQTSTVPGQSAVDTSGSSHRERDWGCSKIANNRGGGSEGSKVKERDVADTGTNRERPPVRGTRQGKKKAQQIPKAKP